MACQCLAPAHLRTDFFDQWVKLGGSRANHLESQEVSSTAILENDRRVRASAREELGRRLMEIPAVGPLLASAFVATVADAHAFKSGRCLSAWMSL